MTLNIGFVTGEFPPMEGGVGAFTQRLAKEMANQGHEVHIITSKKARPKDEKRSIWDVKEPNDLGYAALHARVGSWRWGSLSHVAAAVARLPRLRRAGGGAARRAPARPPPGSCGRVLRRRLEVAGTTGSWKGER